jgi:Protein tyrosine and serine/threonine kinase
MQRDDRTSYTAENDNKQNGPDKGIEERAALQLQLSEAHKIIEQLMSERDEKAVLISEDHQIIEQLMSERDDARNKVKELRQLTEQKAPHSQCVEYSYSELQDATNNFHQSVKLGEGGFGIVYKGILHNTTVAIKILKESSSQGVKEFHQEVLLLPTKSVFNYFYIFTRTEISNYIYFVHNTSLVIFRLASVVKLCVI